MNKVFLIGNLTRDPEMRTTQSGISVCSFTIAVNRRRANRADRLHRPTNQGCNSSTYFASYIGKF